MRNFTRNLVLMITILATFFALAPAANAQQATGTILSTEEQYELSDSEQRAYFDRLNERAATIRYNSEVARDSSSDGSAMVVNYCEYEEDVAACDAAFTYARGLAFDIGHRDARFFIERPGRPANPLVYDNVSAQRGADNGIVVGWYHGKATGLGADIFRWEGANDCRTGFAPIPNVEQWIANLLYSEDTNEQLFAARVLEQAGSAYVKGFQECQNGYDLETWAGNRGFWMGKANHLIGVYEEYFGSPERIDESLMARATAGSERGHLSAHNGLINGTAQYVTPQWGPELSYAYVTFVPEG